jgi:hypothetical protein
MAGTTDWERVQYEQNFDPAYATQGLIAQTGRVDTDVLDKAIERDAFIGPYDFVGGGFGELAKSARGPGKYEWLVQLVKPADMADNKYPPVFSALNNVNMLPMFNGDRALCEAVLREAEVNAETNEEVRQMLKSMLMPVGQMRDREYGPMAPGMLYAQESALTVAQAGKLTVYGPLQAFSMGDTLELYAPGPMDLKDLWANNRDLPENVRFKVTLQARIWQPAEAFWRARRMLHSTYAPAWVAEDFRGKQHPDPPKYDPHAKVAHDMAMCHRMNYALAFYHGMLVAGHAGVAGAPNADVIVATARRKLRALEVEAGVRFPKLWQDADGGGVARAFAGDTVAGRVPLLDRAEAPARGVPDPTSDLLDYFSDPMFQWEPAAEGGTVGAQLWQVLSGNVQQLFDHVGEVQKANHEWVPGKIAAGADMGEFAGMAVHVP